MEIGKADYWFSCFTFVCFSCSGTLLVILIVPRTVIFSFPKQSTRSSWLKLTNWFFLFYVNQYAFSAWTYFYSGVLKGHPFVISSHDMAEYFVSFLDIACQKFQSTPARFAVLLFCEHLWYPACAEFPKSQILSHIVIE